jgi:hypothetical protein
MPLGQHGHHRQEDQLTGGAGSSQHAHHQATPAHKPAVGDGSREHHGHRAGAKADQQPPGDHQLPAMANYDGQPAASGHQHQGEASHPADPEPVHQRGGERSHQPVQHQVQADRARHQGSRPTELLLQWHHQHPGRSPETSGTKQGHERDQRHPPRRMDPPVAPARAPSLIGLGR